MLLQERLSFIQILPHTVRIYIVSFHLYHQLTNNKEPALVANTNKSFAISVSNHTYFITSRLQTYKDIESGNFL